MATLRQQLAVKKVLENPGSISKAMREAGYSEKTAKNPKDLTESKAWQELMDKHISDDALAKVHREGLQATKTENKIEVIDHPTRHKFMETGYKLKGKFQDKTEISGNVIISGINYITPSGINTRTNPETTPGIREAEGQDI